jgi:hypothetical protein
MNLYNIEKVFGIMNTFNISETFRLKAERNWDTIYVVVDLHGTIAKPFHDCFELYPGALEVLQWFSDRPDIKIILWTSSHFEEVKSVLVNLKLSGVTIDFVNANPLEANTKRADFSKKFYFNILLDDKAGFEPETDWFAIKEELIRIGEWKVTPNENVLPNNPSGV